MRTYWSNCLSRAWVSVCNAFAYADADAVSLDPTNWTPCWRISGQSVTLNRPRALNALSTALFAELNDAFQNFDDDVSTNAIVLTGSEKAFAGTVQTIKSKR